MEIFYRPSEMSLVSMYNTQRSTSWPKILLIFNKISSSVKCSSVQPSDPQPDNNINLENAFAISELQLPNYTNSTLNPT